MKRIPEPELMNEAAQVQAYAAADFEQAHSRFIELFAECFARPLQAAAEDSAHFALDLGCGPGDISRRIARQLPGCIVHAVDGATNMLDMAARLNREARLDQRIVLFDSLVSDLDLPRAHYDVIFSNSLLHHLHNPADMWAAIRRYARPGTRVFVMDLLRPGSAALATQLVDKYAADEADILRHDFYHSLCAAFTLDEVDQQLHQCGLDYCHSRQVSDRHLIVYGETP